MQGRADGKEANIVFHVQGAGARDSYVITISVAIRHFEAFLLGHLLPSF